MPRVRTMHSIRGSHAEKPPEIHMKPLEVGSQGLSCASSGQHLTLSKQQLAWGEREAVLERSI